MKYLRRFFAGFLEVFDIFIEVFWKFSGGFFGSFLEVYLRLSGDY